MKKSILDFHRMAKTGEKITWLTGYDYLTAKYEEKAGVDMILVGDSLGMVTLGYDTTYPVTMDELIIHSRAVRRGDQARGRRRGNLRAHSRDSGDRHSRVRPYRPYAAVRRADGRL